MKANQKAKGNGAGPQPWTVPPLWKQQTAILIGGGPSLTPAQVSDAVRSGARILAINDAYLICTEADILYGCDAKWWAWHHGAPSFDGYRITSDIQAATQWGLTYIPGKHADGLSDDPQLIHYGKNSGYQAINLAYLLGATTIILLGYDMKFGADGRAHWFGDHPDKVRSGYEGWIPLFRTMQPQLDAAGVQVINASPDSALDAFPLMDLSGALDHGTADRHRADH